MLWKRLLTQQGLEDLGIDILESILLALGDVLDEAGLDEDGNHDYYEAMDTILTTISEFRENHQSHAEISPLETPTR